MECARSVQSPVGRGLRFAFGAARVSSGCLAVPSTGMEPWR
jgi:hypothetical protein